MSRLPWIRVQGSALVDESAREVILAGFALGGWMNIVTRPSQRFSDDPSTCSR